MEAVPWRIVKALEIDECRGTDSSLSTNACKPISKSVNQTPTHCPLLHTETVESVCERERERERECVTSSRFRPWKGQTFCKNKSRSSRFSIELVLRSSPPLNQPSFSSSMSSLWLLLQVSHSTFYLERKWERQRERERDVMTFLFFRIKKFSWLHRRRLRPQLFVFDAIRNAKITFFFFFFFTA